MFFPSAKIRFIALIYLISISEKYEEIYCLHENLPNIFVWAVSLSIINQFNLPDSF